MPVTKSASFPRSLPLTLFFGIAMIAMLWTGIVVQTESEFSAARNAASQRLANLARVFDEHVDRTIRELDKALLIARKQYLKRRETSPYEAAIRASLPDPQLLSDMSFQLAMIDRTVRPSTFTGRSTLVRMCGYRHRKALATVSTSTRSRIAG